LLDPDLSDGSRIERLIDHHVINEDCVVELERDRRFLVLGIGLFACRLVGQARTLNLLGSPCFVASLVILSDRSSIGCTQN